MASEQDSEILKNSECQQRLHLCFIIAKLFTLTQELSLPQLTWTRPPAPTHTNPETYLALISAVCSGACLKLYPQIKS